MIEKMASFWSIFASIFFFKTASKQTEIPVMQKSGCRSPGFTLVELVIVVAIIGILASIAYPSYLNQVRKARRADAQKDLMVLANHMERFFTTYNRYDHKNDADDKAGTSATPVSLPFFRSPRSGPDIFYQLSLSKDNNVGQFTYKLLAVPVPQSSQAGDSCGTLTIDQAGAKGADYADCW